MHLTRGPAVNLVHIITVKDIAEVMIRLFCVILFSKKKLVQVSFKTCSCLI